jgi:hypothetical protein
MESGAILHQTVDGAALSWTPSMEQCLAAGGQFAWAVRARHAKGVSEWSDLRLFQVAGEPSLAEIRKALEVLQRADPRALERHPIPKPSPSETRTIGASMLQQPEPQPVLPPPDPPGLSIDSDGTAVANAFVFACGENATSIFFRDFDEDTFGSADDPARACQIPAGYVSNSSDCDDLRANRNLECICDPYDPTVDCGAESTRCTPSFTGDGVCHSDPVGSGVQGDACASQSDCAFDHFCDSTFAFQCYRWCRVAQGSGDCTGETTCSSGAPMLLIGGEEWNLCL